MYNYIHIYIYIYMKIAVSSAIYNRPQGHEQASEAKRCALIQVYTYTHTYIKVIYVYVYIYIYIFMSVYIEIYMYIYMCICIYICMYIYIYMHIYIYIYIYIYIHTHTHTHRAALLHVGAVSNASQARSSSHSADCVAGWTGVYSGGVIKTKREGVTSTLGGTRRLRLPRAVPCSAFVAPGMLNTCRS